MSLELLTEFKRYVSRIDRVLDNNLFTAKETALLYFMEGFKKRIYASKIIKPFQGQLISYNKLYIAGVFSINWSEKYKSELEER